MIVEPKRFMISSSSLFSAVLALGLALGIAQPAFAQSTDEFGSYGARPTAANRGSPQSVAFEVRFGRYVPDVDKEFNGRAHPFEKTFGDSNRYLLGMELDWQLLRIPKFGSLGPGVGWGYTSASARAQFTDGTGESGEDTTFKVMPMYAVGVLRFDYLALETRVPLAAYVKAGLGYALWWTSTSGETDVVDGKAGKGSSYGYNFAIGAQFLLNPLDRASAVEMDYSVGINRVYLFGEWYKSDLNGFGTGRMQVGTSTWMGGLTFEI